MKTTIAAMFRAMTLERRAEEGSPPPGNARGYEVWLRALSTLQSRGREGA